MSLFTPFSLRTFNSCRLSNVLFQKFELSSPRVMRNFSSNRTDAVQGKEGSSKKKKPVLVTLIGTDNNVSYVTLEEASKLTNRRGLKLVKMTEFDPKKKCAVYRVFTSAQYLGEEIQHKKATKQQPTGFKSEKIISFSNKISSHDVQSKVRQILKWTEKDHQVRATVSGTEPKDQQAEKIYAEIENLIGKQARILQKRNAGVDIKFQVIPPKNEKENNESTS